MGKLVSMNKNLLLLLTIFLRLENWLVLSTQELKHSSDSNGDLRKLQKKVRPCSGYTGKDKKECKRLTGKDGNGIRNKGLCAGKTRKECNALICEGEDCTPFCEQEKEKKRMKCVDKCNQIKDTKCTEKDGGKKKGICKDKTKKECREFICTAEEDCETLCAQLKKKKNEKCIDKCNLVRATKC